MKLICLAAAGVVLIAGCASTSPPANNQTAGVGRAGTDTYILHGTGGSTPSGSTSKPPRLSVGVSDPNTQLILPWFLNDIINFVNYH
ncbi:hypothetical protein FAZ95_28530 [Trinickia violacea]|uniref:Lipoprotein n=2 Tax=Trinickia violacea TaxID=2571746 RepID=A0A4P8J1W4_9BURK|nr:hypothetical protein FAZ95_28530 [Trinickia violacea]